MTAAAEYGSRRAFDEVAHLPSKPIFARRDHAFDGREGLRIASLRPKCRDARRRCGPFGRIRRFRDRPEFIVGLRIPRRSPTFAFQRSAGGFNARGSVQEFSVQLAACNRAFVVGAAHRERGLYGSAAAGLQPGCDAAVRARDPRRRSDHGLHGPKPGAALAGMPRVLQARSCRQAPQAQEADPAGRDLKLDPDRRAPLATSAAPPHFLHSKNLEEARRPFAG
jgi:hypothetical protein